MSPVRAAEHHVSAEGGDGYVAVRAPAAQPVVVTWFCGDAVTFDREALREAIANVDRVKGFAEVHLKLRDRSGREFHVRVVDGELYADWSASLDHARHVPWADLRKALKKAAD